MFIDDDPRDALAATDMPTRITARDLLLACASEAWRQSAAAARLDAVLGASLGAMRSSGSAVSDRPEALAPLAGELQKADLLRQELEGLARTLALLANVRSFSASLTAEQVRLCAPLGELQGRLLSGAGRMASD